MKGDQSARSSVINTFLSPDDAYGRRGSDPRRNTLLEQLHLALAQENRPRGKRNPRSRAQSINASTDNQGNFPAFKEEIEKL